jgi:hypothetical protein
MCGGPAPVFSLLRPTEHVTLLKPHGMVNGGMVSPRDVNIPVRALAPNDPDRVLVRLMPGELVVPTKHVASVAKFLKSRKVFLPGM